MNELLINGEVAHGLAVCVEDPGSGCHVSRLGDYGYRSITITGRTMYAHRYVWALTHGEIPKGLVIRHICNNKACCRPEHLALGTHRHNAHDRENQMLK